ncbi:MAG TPA: aspartyl protease family protein [Thermoplasmata archaeon]|nr:aspartyl protease family protein [Thermoplasmata archaeon]
MGETYARVTVANEKKSRTKRLLVDTGSTLTWLRREFLETLGVRVMEQEEFELMDGRVVTREISEARIAFGGKTRTTNVVFAERGESKVLGMVALEALALAVDPVRRKLRPVRAIKACSGVRWVPGAESVRSVPT